MKCLLKRKVRCSSVFLAFRGDLLMRLSESPSESVPESESDVLGHYCSIKKLILQTDMNLKVKVLTS